MNKHITTTSSIAVLLFIISTSIVFAQIANESPGHIADEFSPFHLSWSSNQTRWDFVFSPSKNITVDLTKLLSLVASNSSTIAQCRGQRGCLFKNGNLLQAYNTSTLNGGKFILKSQIDDQSFKNSCRKSYTSVEIHNHCSTLWNPPRHISGTECQHTIEWHSPYSCTANQTNYASPCYVHDISGKLIDLTHLVMSNGSSYKIDTGNFNTTIKEFHLNVCNDAGKACSPNASSCRSDTKKGLVETGYTNSTLITFDPKEKSVHLVSLGEFNENCADKRVKTVVKFRCPEKFVNPTNKPVLVSANDCENIIDWSTVRACPVPDVQTQAVNCAIKYEPLGIDINLKNLFLNQTVVEVSDIALEGKNKTMILGLCQGINPSTYRCAGKSSHSTMACLLDEGETMKKGDTKNSQVVGSVTKSMIKLADSRLLLESFVTNKTCEVPVSPNFNYARQVGTRIEIVCSETDDLKPKFIGFEDCVYVFEWGSSKLCLENMISPPQISQPSNSTTPKPKVTPSSSTSSVPMTNHTENDSVPDDTTKTAHDMHKDTVADSKDMLKPEENSALNPATEPQVTIPDPNNGHRVPPSGKMNKVHKFFMIGLIVMSLTAFVVVIFILDRRTNFKIPLGRIGRRARQVLRPQPVPYTRVSFNDNLDL